MPPPPYPTVRLNPDLLPAARRSPKSLWAIAVLAGFGHYPVFSKLLHSERVPATPLVIERLRKVAQIIGFDGPVFLDAPPAQEAK